MRTNLTGATRATGRSMATLLRWLAESGRMDDATRATRPDLFTADEARHDGPTTGRGVMWSLAVDALERVHRAHGGVYWNAEAASIAVVALPPSVVAEMAALRAENARLADRLAALMERGTEHGAEHGAEHGRREPSPAHVPAYSPRVLRTTRAAHVDDDTPPLPEGWEALSSFVARLGLYRQRVEKLIANGALPVPHNGAWRRGPNILRYVYDPAQQAEALASLIAHGLIPPDGTARPPDGSGDALDDGLDDGRRDDDTAAEMPALPRDAAGA